MPELKSEPLVFSGIVLAGGESRRLGTDKALLDFGGRTLLEITVQRLLEVTPDVLVACGQGARPHWPDVNARMVEDQAYGRGPLAGLDAGLRNIRAEVSLVVACDMPFLNTALLADMAGHLGRHDAVVPVINGRYHPLHGVYSKRCLPSIQDILLEGGSMRDLLAAVDTAAVFEDELRILDPEGMSWFNLNSPEDLDKARAIWSRRQATSH